MHARHIELIYPYYRYNNRTFTAITAVHRLLQYSVAERVPFLVDTRSLADQAYEAFLNYADEGEYSRATACKSLLGGVYSQESACEHSSSADSREYNVAHNADTAVTREYPADKTDNTEFPFRTRYPLLQLKSGCRVPKNPADYPVHISTIQRFYSLFYGATGSHDKADKKMRRSFPRDMYDIVIDECQRSIYNTYGKEGMEERFCLPKNGCGVV